MVWINGHDCDDISFYDWAGVIGAQCYCPVHSTFQPPGGECICATGGYAIGYWCAGIGPGELAAQWHCTAHDADHYALCSCKLADINCWRKDAQKQNLVRTARSTNNRINFISG